MPRNPKLSLIALSLYLMTFATTSAVAQDYAMSPVQFPSAFNVNAMAQIGKVYDRSASRQLSGRNIGVLPPNKSFLFEPSVTRRRANLAKFVEKTRATDPKGAAKMATMFASSDPIAMLGAGIAGYGLRTDNAADAYTVYWMTAWQAAHGDTSDFTRSQAQAVKAQSAGALVATPEFIAANDATKQEFAEAMMVQAMLISASLDTYKNNPAMMRQLGAAVRKGAKASGLDLDAMTLTDQGFVPSGKTGAADPAPGAAEQALAANAAATPPVAANDTSPPYILLAAAGGAGLGGVFLLGKMMGKRG
jgi:hypothetical protein